MFWRGRSQNAIAVGLKTDTSGTHQQLVDSVLCALERVGTCDRVGESFSFLFEILKDRFSYCQYYYQNLCIKMKYSCGSEFMSPGRNGFENIHAILEKSPVKDLKTSNILKTVLHIVERAQQNKHNTIIDLIQIDLYYGHGYFNVSWDSREKVWYVKHDARFDEVISSEINVQFSKCSNTPLNMNTASLTKWIQFLVESGQVWSITWQQLNFTEHNGFVNVYEPHITLRD